MRLLSVACAASLALLCPSPVPAQEESPAAEGRLPAGDRRLVVEPERLELSVGEQAQLAARVLGVDGQVEADARIIFTSRSRRSITVDAEGHVQALRPGDFVLVVRTSGFRDERLEVEVPARVLAPPLASLAFGAPLSALYAGTSTTVAVRALDAAGAERADVELSWSASDPAVASFDPFGELVAHAPGKVRIRAACGDLGVERELVVLENPIQRLELALESAEVRTGDVVHVTTVATDREGRRVAGVPIQLSFQARPDDDLGPPASGQITPDGRFVAETPGLYTLVATSGAAVGRINLRARARGVQRELELVGRGKVHDTHTSDLWVWQGVDGRDYAVTGTWGANGEAHFWDVTDPADIRRIATVTADARTINDVKVSADGRLCAISREGASNRKNGIVLYDVTDPANPQALSGFDDGLTGGVHNVFVDGQHVYALSAGRRYDVIDVADPRSPRKVGSYELDTPGHSIHDVWVADGVAYSSNWSDGVQLVDVGNGIAGGSPENPVRFASYAYPSGWNHAAFPYRNATTGRFYVAAGDEAFPYGLHVEGSPTYPRGWVHFIDFTDLEHPVEIARYQVPEAGTHNLWIEDDVLYAAFYNGGLRVVDVSGELLGDLYRQGREMAWFLPTDPEGHIANAPMVWGPQPYKGNIFFSDWNTGLWCVRLKEGGVRR